MWCDAKLVVKFEKDCMNWNLPVPASRPYVLFYEKIVRVRPSFLELMLRILEGPAFVQVSPYFVIDRHYFG